MNGHVFHDRTSRRAFLAVGAAAAVTMTGRRSASAQEVAPEYWPTEDWRLADPADVGVDSFALDAVDARVPDEVPALSALLAARHGYIVMERYYAGQDPEMPINVRSVTKSVTGTLAGAALRSGLLYGLEQTVGETIPHRIPEDADPLVADITLWQ